MEELLAMFGAETASVRFGEAGLLEGAEAVAEELGDMARPQILARMDAEVEIR